MQIICPCCSAKFSLEAVLSDAAARLMVAWALKLPAPVGDQVVRYLALFRPEGRALSWPRAARLLQQLHDDIKRGEIERRGRSWPAPLHHWQAALDEMHNSAGKLTLPLKSHGYLYEILVGMADKVEAKQERDEEDRHRNRSAAGAEMTELKSRLASLQELYKNEKNELIRRTFKRQLDEIQSKIDRLSHE